MPPLESPVLPWKAFRSTGLALALQIAAAPFWYLGLGGRAGRIPGGNPDLTLALAAAVTAAAVWVVLPTRLRILRLEGSDVTVDGKVVHWTADRIHDGAARAGATRADAVRFLARHHARASLATRGDADLLAGDALGASVDVGYDRTPRWGYAAVVAGDPATLVGTFQTPEALLVAQPGFPPDATIRLAGYDTGDERRLLRPVVRLDLVRFDPFFAFAATCGHYGGALAPLDGGNLADLVASVRHRRTRPGADEHDRREIPEVDVWVAPPPTATEWPARLAALLAYRAIAGPIGTLDARTFEVLRRWIARGDRTFGVFLAAFDRLLEGPAGKYRDPVEWPDDLREAVRRDREAQGL